MDTMEEIDKKEYGQKRESHFFDLGNDDLEFILLSEKAFQSTIENYKLALKEWDSRAFNQLGIAYATWAEKGVLDPKLQEHYLKLAKEAFSSAIYYNQETQAYFNLGLVNGYLASLNEDRFRVEYYESAAYSFKSAVEHGDQKAYGHLALVYSILGFIHENIEKKYEFNQLAIENAKSAIAGGWSGCYGTMGTAYRNLGDLSSDREIKEQNYRQAIDCFQEAVQQGNDGFNSDLESAKNLLNNLSNEIDGYDGMGDADFQNKFAYKESEDGDEYLDLGRSALNSALESESREERNRYFDKAIGYNQLAINRGWKMGYGALGVIYIYRGDDAVDIQEQKEYYETALHFIQQAIDHDIPYEYGNKAFVYGRLRDLETLQAEKNRYLSLEAQTLFETIEKGLTRVIYDLRDPSEDLLQHTEDDISPEDLIAFAETQRQHTEDLFSKSPFISLVLGSRHDISPEDLIAFAATQPSLVELDLSEWEHLTDDDLTSLAECCPNLVSLNLKGCTHITDQSLLALTTLFPKLMRLS
jgi:hypothetical protein